MGLLAPDLFKHMEENEVIQSNLPRGPLMNFHVVFFTLVTATLLSGSTSLYLANQSDPNPQQIQLINTCTDTWKLCIGAISGLLGSRTLSQPIRPSAPDQEDTE
jgi:hypothetical protein